MSAAHESDWYVLTRLGPRAWWLRRTPQPFDSLRDVRTAAEPLLDVLERERPRAMVVDLRQAPSRNDPEFERVFAPYRARMSTAAEQTALLLRSKVGELQVQRLARQDGVELRLFHDEAPARAWLDETASRG